MYFFSHRRCIHTWQTNPFERRLTLNRDWALAGITFKEHHVMKDELGLYYHPQAGNTLSRVYVRRGEHGEVEFRLWRADMPDVWERHPWLSMSVVQDASELYRQERNADADPLKLYDLAVARALLKEDEA